MADVSETGTQMAVGFTYILEGVNIYNAAVYVLAGW